MEDPPADLLRLIDHLRDICFAPSLADSARLAVEAAVEVLAAESASAYSRGGELAHHPTAAQGFDPGAHPEIVPGTPSSTEVRGRPAQVLVAAATEGRDGTLAVLREGPPFSAADAHVLQGLVGALAIAIHTAESMALVEELRESHLRETLKRRRSEADYATLMDRIPAIVYLAEMGEEGRWRFVSPKIEDILGFTPEEWTSDPRAWIKQIHPEDREHALSFETEEYLGLPAAPPAEYRMLTKDGRVVWILERARLQADEHGVPIWHGVMYDVTDLKEAQRNAERLAGQQAVIADLGERALKGAEPSRLMDTAVRLVAESQEIAHCCIWMRDEDGGLVLAHSSHEADRDRAGGPAPAGSFPAAAIRSDPDLRVADWSRERKISLPPELASCGIRSSLALPIPGQDRPIGVIEVHAIAADRFRTRDAHFLRSAANVLADAINRRDAEERLRHQLVHDPLTGLPNRRLFTRRLEQAIGRAEALNHAIGILFLDLDDFKLINDSLGHHAGDQLLRRLAPRLSEGLRGNDTVARFGGDEFGIVLEPVADEHEAARVAERIGSSLAEPIEVEGVEHFVTASIGIVVYRPGRDRPADAASLLRDADAAMYRAKEMGKASHQLFGRSMRDRTVRRLETQRELRTALERDQLAVEYQPIVAVDSLEVSGLEALLRWFHPRLGQVDPMDFVSIAEEIGIIDTIGRWLTERVCADSLSWAQPGQPPPRVSVNISARQITHNDLPTMISEVLAETGFPATALTLELTETVLLEESMMTTEALDELSAMGVRLVLDDFGTGYSSLAYLNRFPIDALKIDRSFVERIGARRGGGLAIVEAILAMAEALSLDVVAEGVTDQGQLEVLRRLGCGYAQGYLFSKPVPPERVPELLRASPLTGAGSA